MRSPSPYALIAILISGCASTQPERVFVDADRVLASEPVPKIERLPLPHPPPGTSTVVVKQMGLPLSTTTDRTKHRLEQAKDLIEQNRTHSIAALSSMLERVYVAQANDAALKREHAARGDQEAILTAALDRLHIIFVEYGGDRGPLLAHLNVLTGNTNLTDEEIPENADGVTRFTTTRSNAIRAKIRALDANFDAEASLLLDQATQEIQAELDQLNQRAATEVGEAKARAAKEAEANAALTKATLDVKVQGLVPEGLEAVPDRTAVVAGTAPLPLPPPHGAGPIFGSLEQRRRIVEEEIDLWIRSTGRLRATSSAGGPDVTEEFLKWKSAHKVGP